MIKNKLWTDSFITFLSNNDEEKTFDANGKLRKILKYIRELDLDLPTINTIHYLNENFKSCSLIDGIYDDLKYLASSETPRLNSDGNDDQWRDHLLNKLLKSKTYHSKKRSNLFFC